MAKLWHLPDDIQPIDLSEWMSLFSKLQNFSPKREATQSPITQMVAKLLAGDDLLMTSPTNVHFVDWLKASQQLLHYLMQSH